MSSWRDAESSSGKNLHLTLSCLYGLDVANKFKDLLLNEMRIINYFLLGSLNCKPSLNSLHLERCRLWFRLWFFEKWWRFRLHTNIRVSLLPLFAPVFDPDLQIRVTSLKQDSVLSNICYSPAFWRHWDTGSELCIRWLSSWVAGIGCACSLCWHESLTALAVDAGPFSTHLLLRGLYNLRPAWEKGGGPPQPGVGSIWSS